MFTVAGLVRDNWSPPKLRLVLDMPIAWRERGDNILQHTRFGLCADGMAR